MPVTDRPNRDIKQREAKRTPLGVARQKLVLNDLDDSEYKYRWINDIGTRVAEALRGGYEFVPAEEAGTIGIRDVEAQNHSLGSGVSKVVEKSNGTKAYLMRIKREWFDEDQAAKQRAITEKEAQMHKGHVPGLEGRTRTSGEHKITRDTE